MVDWRSLIVESISNFSMGDLPAVSGATIAGCMIGSHPPITCNKRQIDYGVCMPCRQLDPGIPAQDELRSPASDMPNDVSRILLGTVGEEAMLVTTDR